MNRKILILVGILISVFFLWYSLKGTDFGEIGEGLARANFWLCIPLLTAFCTYYWIKAIRWRMLLEPMKKTTAREIFSPMMIGFMFNNILPAHLGEFVRMVLGARQLGLRNTQVLATIVLERVFDILSVVLFLGIAILVDRNVDPDLVTVGYITSALGAVFMVVTVLYVTWTEGFLALLNRVTFFIPPLSRIRGLGFLLKLRNGIIHQLEIGVQGLYALKKPRLLFGIVLTSLLQWSFMGLSAYIAMLAVGIDTPLSAGFVVLAATTFGVTLPAAPGFLGTIQAMFKAALVPYGVSADAAFAASAFFHVPTYLIVTLPGLYLLRRTGYKLRQIQQEAEAAAGKGEGAED